MKSAASSDLVAKAMTNFIIWAIDRMAPLNCENRLFSIKVDVSTCSAARAGFIEEACICVGTKYHVACTIDYAVIRIGSNIVKEEVHSLFCGDGGFGLAGRNGTECHE